MRQDRRHRALWRAGLVAALLTGTPALGEIRLTLDGLVKARTAAPIGIEVAGSGDYTLGNSAPRAWLVPEPDGPCAPPAAGSARTELDGWVIVLRNSDNTVSVVDPKKSLASSNIAWVAPAGFPVADWRVDSEAGLVRLWPVGGAAPLALDLTDGALRDVAAPAAELQASTAQVRSELAREVYRLEPAGRSIHTEPSDPGAPPRIFELEEPAQEIMVSPDGRWLMALSPAKGLVQVVDLALGRQTRAIVIHAGFGRAAFTDSYLYLREQDRAFVSLVQLASLARPQVHVVAIPVGLSPSTDAMAPVGNNGMAFLHAADRAVYLYMESGMSDTHGAMRSPTEMLAPYDVVRLRGSTPVDLAIHDQSLRQLGPGRFAGTISPAHGGPWRLVASDRQSRQVSCLDFQVEGPGPPKAPDTKWQLVALSDDPARFRLVGPSPAALPARLDLLAMVPGSNWQRRVTAVREKDDAYRIEGNLPRVPGIMIVPADPNLSHAALQFGGQL